MSYWSGQRFFVWVWPNGLWDLFLCPFTNLFDCLADCQINQYSLSKYYLGAFLDFFFLLLFFILLGGGLSFNWGYLLLLDRLFFCLVHLPEQDLSEEIVNILREFKVVFLFLFSIFFWFYFFFTLFYLFHFSRWLFFRKLEKQYLHILCWHGLTYTLKSYLNILPLGGFKVIKYYSSIAIFFFYSLLNHFNYQLFG